jgi:very-short-patch-repair endonuclease
MRAGAESSYGSLAAFARDHGGCLTAERVRSFGLTEGEVRTLVRRGLLVRVRRGVLAIPGEPLEVVGAQTPDQQRAVVASLLAHGDSVASHESAARAWGLPLLGQAARTGTTVTRPGELARTPAGASDDRVLTSELPPGHVVRLRPWLPMTSPARTVADLARTRGPEDGLVAADAALATGLLSREQYSGVLEDCAQFPGIGRALTVAGEMSGLAESPLESLSRHRLRGFSLPEPELQVEVRRPDGTLVARVDFLFGGRVVGEADGRGKYRSAADLWAEKRREDELRALGYAVVRWSWDDMWLTPHQVSARIAAALAAAPARQRAAR